MIRLGIDGRELQNDSRSGIGRYVTDVLRAASLAGWECLVYVTNRIVLPSNLSGISLRMVKKSWTPWWDQVLLPRALSRDGVSIFLSPYYKGPIHAPCPVVITIHDLLFIRYPGTWRPIYDWMMTVLASLYSRRAQAIITDSVYSKRCIVERLGVSSEHIQVIPLALNPRFTQTAVPSSLLEQYDLHHPYILYVGNFKPHKNLEQLLYAFAGLDESVRGALHLVLAGQDRMHQQILERLCHRLGIMDQVRFPGFVPDEDLPALYSGALFSVLPSLVEGFGLTALESMGCGCPVMASNRASIPEVVGNAALLFDPEHGEAMTMAMQQLLSQKPLREEYRQKGLLRAAEFDQRHTTDKVLTLLQDVQKGRMRIMRTDGQVMEPSSECKNEWQ